MTRQDPPVSVARRVTTPGRASAEAPSTISRNSRYAVVRHVLPERARRRKHGLGVPAMDGNLLYLVPGHRPRRRRLAPPGPAGCGRARRRERVAQGRAALAQPVLEAVVGRHRHLAAPGCARICCPARSHPRIAAPPRHGGPGPAGSMPGCSARGRPARRPPTARSRPRSARSPPGPPRAPRPSGQHRPPAPRRPSCGPGPRPRGVVWGPQGVHRGQREMSRRVGDVSKNYQRAR